MSLCYYCSATGDRRKGFVVVDSGVEAANLKKAEQEILRQLDTVKGGRFGDFEFESSKRSIINALGSYSDNQEALDNWYALRCTAKAPISPEEYADLIALVDKAAVIESAKGVKLHTVYGLIGNGEQ